MPPFGGDVSFLLQPLLTITYSFLCLNSAKIFMKKLIPAAGLFLALVTFSCSKPTIVGSDLLAQDQIDIGFTDTFSLITTNVLTDSVRTFSPEFNNQMVAYLVGEMDDPIFGRTVARIHANFRSGSEEPDFTDAVLDSVVLVLPYYGFSQYGDTMQMYGLDVYELAEQMSSENEYFSNAEFQIGDLIGTSDLFIPRPSDSITVNSHGGEPDETIDLPAQLRIRLNDAFGQRFLDEPIETYEDDSTFLASYPGIQIVPNTVNAGLSAFNLRTDPFAAIVVYYHVGERIP